MAIRPFRRGARPALLALLLAGLPGAAAASPCPELVEAKVVALDQPFSLNRYGALEPQGMIYALERDVVDVDDADGLPSPGEVQDLRHGQVRLRRDKRPRPLVLRVNAGQCLFIHFRNLLAEERRNDKQPATRAASIHVAGMQAETIESDGSRAGENPSGIVYPGEQITYILFAEHEGTFVMRSMGAPVGGEGDGGSISPGLFGAVNVEPAGSEWYRSQVTQADLERASRTVNGSLIIDYQAKYPDNHRYAGLPILRMTLGNEIVHSDLTAIITGSRASSLAAAPARTKLHPNRGEPYREFTVIFHDELGAVQAFQEFEDEVLGFTLHGTRDAFAINYGTGGIGAEVLANRFGVGPGFDCVECKYEEFFLTSWVVGDPAMIVDTPANFPCNERGTDNCTPEPGRKATVAHFPDDPSNVYHSYLNDRVIFRNLHAGSDDHHIFHLHAHQWTHTPRDNQSAYLDSQSIGPGAGFTYEIAYGGSGNRNRTAGDSIFHCHFYPHFAQGMWSLWRVHDVLELGTRIDAEGRPAQGARALPDNEILAGTPIPAVVPLPTLPMAPVPFPVEIDDEGQIMISDEDRLRELVAAQRYSEANPGFPFWIPGRAGRRPPHPPLDTVFDGGLPRHRVAGGSATSREDRHDFSKVIDKMTVEWLPEAGDELERIAMEFHSNKDGHKTRTPAGVSGAFRVNRSRPQPGAPFADPCVDDAGNPLAQTRVYKAADLQIDAVLNKSGWHYPQQRIITLLDDIAPTLRNERPPEPLFIRANSGECVHYELTNLVPNEYQLDDFQVRTPTDVLGQHIHLVKFDVTASDGAANGYNYEDGSFGGEEVQERLCAIRRAIPSCQESLDAPCNWRVRTAPCPVPKLNPFVRVERIDPDCDGHLENLGAQTTVQRWWADPIPVEGTSQTRTLRTVFTHDHFGPSTHQQTGLYAGLIVEPPNTKWYHNETGARLGTRGDGGPTSWQAVVRGSKREENFREFGLQVQDFVLAYRPGGPTCPDKTRGFADFARAVNPPGRDLVGPPVLYENPDDCPTESGADGPPRPCPEAVSADDPGMTSVNYRNEPIALRVSTEANEQADGRAGNLSFAYMTRRDRAREEFNRFPFTPHLPEVPYPALTKGLRRGDPFTPLLRAYEGDNVVIRALAGAHEEEHNFTVHGVEWLFEPNRPDSGWRNSQHLGISQYFDMLIAPQVSLKKGEFADFLYKPTAAAEWQWNGAWGLMRVYRGRVGDLTPESLVARTAALPADKTGTSPSEAAEDLADAPAADDLEVIGDESLLVLEDQNPDAEVSDAERSSVFAEVDLEEALADGMVLSRNPEAEAVGGIETGTGTGTGAGAAPPGLSATAAKSDRRIRIACPAVSMPPRAVHVYAVAASEALQNDPYPSLVYNARGTDVRYVPSPDPEPDPAPTPGDQNGPLHDPTAILFVHAEDLDWVNGRPRLSQEVRREPLVLRANQGECLKVKLTNALPSGYEDLPGWNAVPMIIEGFNANDVEPSRHVALHPQLVHFDIRRGDGSNAGLNPKSYNRQTVAPGETKTFYWYAGDVVEGNDGVRITPIEYGATGLSSADPIKHANKGAVGALIVEPAGSEWERDTTAEPVAREGGSWIWEPRKSRAAATVTTPGGSFREFVFIVQDNVNLRYKSGDPVESLIVNEDPTESAQKAVNYKTEPIWFRVGVNPRTQMDVRNAFESYEKVLSNDWTGEDPHTPVFEAQRGAATRFRLVHPGGHTQAHVFDLHGHVWQELPYVNGSRDIGTNQESEWQGARGGFGPSDHGEAIPAHGAGGYFGTAGDYLARDSAGWLLDDGLWMLLRVRP